VLNKIMLSVSTTTTEADEFRVAIRYRTADGIERSAADKFPRTDPERSIWTNMLFITGEAELLSVSVSERIPQPAQVFEP